MTAPRRVVIAEDEALIRLDLAEMLVESGFDVVGQAADGEQALVLTDELRPDLVIMDLKMPQQDGMEAAAEIVRKHIAPVVVATAFSQREFVERVLDVGAVGYLVKPFSKSDLLPAIETAVNRYTEPATLRRDEAEMIQRLAARRLIDRAKGLLMSRNHMTEPQAFRWLQRAAMDRRMPMQIVATNLIATFSD